MPNNKIDTIRADVLPTIPELPGIYKYFDAKNNLLYVGKAKNLKKRVASYFVRQHTNTRTRLLVYQIDRLEYAVVETEQDALLLENVLIKQWQPKYNVQLKDDKTYPFICIRKERFPRIFITRKIVRDGSEYLGPFSSTQRVMVVLDLLKQLFPIRNCNLDLSDKKIASGKFKVCLEYHLGNCKGPCQGFQTEAEYDENINQVKNILKGNFSSVTNWLKATMNTYAQNLEFEKAHHIKQKLMAFEAYQMKSTIVSATITNVDVFSIESDEVRGKEYVGFLKIINGSIIQTKVVEITKKLDETLEDILVFAIMYYRAEMGRSATEIIVPFAVNYPEEGIKITIPKRGDKKNLLDLAQKNAYYFKKQQIEKNERYKSAAERQLDVLKEIETTLKLTALPTHIECFDNSNFQGTDAVSSMVLFRNGLPSNKEYRHYKVKTVTGANDFATMGEVVERRYKRLLDEEQSLPQLIVIDGGKGQLSAAVESLKKLGIYGQMGIVGIAKKLEEIYVPNDPHPLYIDKRSPALKTLQHLRNEAHRFAITFHRKVRSNNTIKSTLEQVPGISKKTTQKLLQQFKSIAAITAATDDELKTILNAKQLQALRNWCEN
ncbi:MAG: excinuclease ABC subunit C [Chitinophagales bacterium]|jgi:excinuclease ABC subunit C|nr:excinuclease ABC subunit C [Sphingobacteriales bacterium]MBK6888786.1 excinuclease ABC subunit C [Sphingobacteriales bacterium]MBL0246808.1 excinuclease ABC subunit C [Sphingobacteriales bacterium]MCC7056235.1 excinuclease ABC subunit C [Chitinophagales bacterium]MDA0199615.1 excinuclease ABC subunit UvrC [Bacteroidota bacterium]